MTLALTPSDAGYPADASREHAETVDADFQSALMEDLSGPVTARSEDLGWSDLPDTSPPTSPSELQSRADEPEAPDIDTDFVAMLLDGLSDAPSVNSQETDRPPPRYEHEFASAPRDPLAAAPPTSEASEEISPSWQQPVEPHLPDLSSDIEVLDPAEVLIAEAPEPPQFPSPDPVETAGPIDDELESTLLAGLANEPALAPEGSGDPGTSDAPLLAEASPDTAIETPAADSVPVLDFEQTLLEGLPDGPSAPFDDADQPASPEEPAAVPDASPATSSPNATDLLDTEDFASELLEGLSDSPGVSSGDPEPSDLPAVPESVDASFDSYSVEHSQSPDDRADSVLDTASNSGLQGDADHGPAAALAFATDPETERALREGLLRYGGSSSGLDEAQVWPGGIRAAISTLAGGHSSGLVIVDLDGVRFPVGAIHELAEVCEPGTAVIALGSKDTARVNREMLLAGVSDYLVKPVTAETVLQAALRASGADEASAARGCVAGFSGTGGSGATTLAAATALHAAGQGRYVSILDLNRSVSAMGLLLDVEPAPGLDQLFDAAGRSPPDPKLLDGVRTERSERISVYAYRLGSSLPPVPSMRALVWLLDQLRRRSQLVLVDGLDDPETGFDLSGEMNLRILVVEPTPAGCVRAVRTIGLLSGSAPILLVQNHTRKFDLEAGTSLLMEAGVESPPDIAVPFDASLPELASRGWPGERLPRALRKPVTALAEGIFAQAFDVMPAEQAAGA